MPCEEKGMFLVLGACSLPKKEGQGSFRCPACRNQGSYDHYVSRRYLTFYGMPLFSFRKDGEHLNCTSCGEAFEMDVLTAPPGLVQREPCDPRNLRRAMLLAFAELKRLDSDSLDG